MVNMDTHAIIKDFITSGIPEKQAEMIVAKVITIAKNEVDSLGKEQLNLATKSDMEKVRLEIRDVKIDILKWIIPLFLTVLLSNIGIIVTFLLK
jgi:hypothetical protein